MVFQFAIGERGFISHYPAENMLFVGTLNI